MFAESFTKRASLRALRLGEARPGATLVLGGNCRSQQKSAVISLVPVLASGRSSGVSEFKTAREAMASPLARRLFGIDGVSSVFFGGDFVTVSKSDEYPWSVLKPDIFAAIMDHYTSGDPLISEGGSGSPDTAINDDDTEVVAMIKELLETRIRPAVQEDGGDIVFQAFEEDSGRLLLQMRGACSGCPSSAVTLKSGIEGMMKHYVPEVTEVVEVQDESQQVGESEFAKLEKQLSA